METSFKTIKAEFICEKRGTHGAKQNSLFVNTSTDSIIHGADIWC